MSNDSATETPTKILIGLCTYEESQNIRPMLSGLRRAFPDADLLVIDDDSPDDTGRRIAECQQEDPRIELVVRTEERGLGSAIVFAMKRAVDLGYDYFLNLDADQSHDPSQLPRLLQKALENPTLDVVIGSRYVPGGEIIGWPLHRRFMSKMINRFATLFLWLPVNDCSGSMRCYRVDALKSINLDSLECTGYAVLEELLVKLTRSGCKMSEVPITFTEREHGRSKLTLAEVIRSIGFMVRLAWRVRTATPE